MLLLSMIKYIGSDIRPWQSMWYQVLQESHSRASDFQVTALPHEPHEPLGHLGLLGPGWSQPDSLAVFELTSESFYWLEVGLITCLLFKKGVLVWYIQG